MSGLEKRVAEYRENLVRITELKKALIDAEISLVSLKKMLNLSLYDWRKLVKGELKEREKDVWFFIDETPISVRERDKTFKKFQKILLDKDLKATEVASALDVDINKIYRELRDISVVRDYKLRNAVEKYLGVKVFD